jgi:hypothetical protein
MAKAVCEVGSADARSSDDTLVGNDATSKLLQKRYVRGMRFTVRYVSTPTCRELPEGVRARPVSIPFGRNPDRLERALVRHDPTRFQPLAIAL